jgi:D-sedoheptulose 7-phosphate isomerase
VPKPRWIAGAKGKIMTDHRVLILNAPSDRAPTIHRLHVTAAHIICGVERTPSPKG